MRNEVTVGRGDLTAIYMDLKNAIGRLQLLLADLGCLHLNASDVSTFADRANGKKKSFCTDCGQTLEEEINNELEQ